MFDATTDEHGREHLYIPQIDPCQGDSLNAIVRFSYSVYTVSNIRNVRSVAKQPFSSMFVISAVAR